MTRPRYVLLGTVVLAAVAVLLVATLSTREHASTTPSLARGQLVAATATIAPQSHSFGQPVHVQIEALVDRSRLDPDRVHLVTNWNPYDVIGAVVRTRVDVGPLTRLRWTADLHCIVIACVPAPGSVQRNAFDPSIIRYAGRVNGGGALRPIRIAWPHVKALSWLDPIDLQHNAIIPQVRERLEVGAIRPPWRIDTATAPVSYRFSPTAVFWAALALALGLVAAAALLVRPWLPRLGLGRTPVPSRLERALDAVDRARGGEPREERKALELLAAELRHSGRGGLAWTASELAWSSSAPEAERTRALTSDVRRELEGRTNGHGP